MRKMKKALALVLTAAMVLTAVPVSAASPKPAIKKSNKTLKVGAAWKVVSAANVKKFKKAGYKITYKVGNTKVATISKTGRVVAKKAGNTTIKVTFKKNKKTTDKRCALKVKAASANAEGSTAALSASQTGEKEIMVKGTALKSEELKLSRDGKEVSFTATVAANGESAILLTENKLTEATYTVAMGEESATVACEASVPTSIDIGDEIYSTEKILEYNKQYTGQFTFVVRNQWGEDVTKTVSPTINVNGVAATAKKNPNGDGYIALADGVIYPQTMTLGTATVTVNIFDTTYPKLNTNKSLTVTDRATAKTIIFTEIYNADNKAFVERAEASSFYYLFEIQNTAGETVLDARDAIVESLMIYANPGLTKLASAYAAEAVEVVEKQDGTKSLGIRFAMATAGDTLTAGEGSITVMDSASGVSGTGKFTVGYGTTVNTFRAIPPELVVKGEDAEFGYEALDVAGNEVTDFAALRDVVKGTKFQFMMEDGKPALYLKAPKNVGYQTEFFRTTTNATSMVSYNVMAEARPAEVIGLKSDVATGVIAGNSLTFEGANFIVADQYGRSMTSAQYKNFGASYAIAVVVDEDDFTVTSTHQDGVDPLVVYNAINGQKVTLKFNAGNENSRKTVTFELRTQDGAPLSDITTDATYDKVIKNRTQYSQYEQKLVSATIDQIKRYEVSDMNPLRVDANFEDSVYFTPEVQVYGIVGSGTKIALTGEEFSVSVPGAGDIDSLDGNGKSGIKAVSSTDGSSVYISGYTEEDNSDQMLDKEEDFVVNNEHVTSLTRNIEVTINSTGEVFDKEVTISKEERRMASFNLEDPDTGVTIKSKTMALADMVEEEGYDKATNSGTLNTSVFGTWVSSYKDNYNISSDKQSLDSIAPNYYITDIVSGDSSTKPSISGNGTPDRLKLKNFVSGTTFTLTWDFGRGIKKSVGITVE